MTNSLIADYKNAIKSINKSYNRIRKDKKLLNIAGIDWLMDNFYIIAQTHAVLKRDMSGKLFNSMPNTPAKTPVLFNDIYNIVISEKEITTDSLISGLRTIKRDLANKEIHAIPLFISISIIIKISKILLDTADKSFEKSLADLFTKLRENDTYSIKEIFAEISKSEKLLLTDEVYRNMDYKSKSFYRFIIDKLAKKHKISETEVINRALSLSKKEEKAPKNHVGYYLIEKPLGNEKKTPEKPLYKASLIIFTLLIIIATALLTKKPLLLVPIVIISAEIGINFTNYLFSKYIKPKKLVGLNYKSEIPDSSKTLVTIAVLVANPQNVIDAYKKLETYYLGNKNPNIYFSILADSKDSDTQVHKDDQAIITELSNQIKSLNHKYATNTFLGFHRVRKYSEASKKFMGWERKRGGLQHLAEFLRGEKNSYFKHIGEDLSQKSIKYIITLDSDTYLPIGAAQKIVSVADHPLNEFKYENGKILGGYGILQPRIATCLKSAVKSKFSKFFTGISGFDHYQENASDIYQDIFSEATFTGKGLLNVDAFYHVIRKYIPENQVLSHDLLEGSIIRTGLVSDIEFSDGFPSKVVSYYSRMHRWIRGDWQLIPYLKRKIKSPENTLIDNPLKRLSKWKIIDNLRRSIVPVCLILFAFFADNIYYPMIILACISFPVLSNTFDKVFYGDYKYLADRSRVKVISGLKAGLIQGFLLFAFLPYNAYIAADAVIRAVYRHFFSRKNMLEWTTAEESDKRVKNTTVSYFMKMKFNVFLGLLFLIMQNFYFGGIFIIAPYIAKIISEEAKQLANKLTKNDKAYLRYNAYNIWCFFDKFVTKKDNFLPPDNYQKNPFSGVAHRTSPTNIGLYMTTVLTARDLGFITTSKMIEKLENTINTIREMPKYNGHLYNWYNTLNLEILKPEFISTVDSGNFIVCLITLKEGLFEYISKKTIDENTLNAIIDMAEYEKIKLDFSYDSKKAIRKKDIINLCDEILSLSIKSSSKLVRVCEEIKLGLMNYQRQDITVRIENLINEIDKIINETSFKFLYDEKKELFSIGYNEGTLINSYYDLMASEARQASYISIARGEIPKKHWNSMSKNMTSENRYKGLVSWTGTAFEYLMPLLFMPNYELSLWDETYKFIVNGQISYAKKHSIPFGISESGFYSFDNDLNYQYQAFGAPAHGLKRGLENDLVISPYSSFLCLPINFRKVISNLKRLEKMGVNSEFGFFEAVDFTKSRAKNKRGYNIVESYMSHHQGMSILSINNCINDNILSKRFMQNKEMQACEELLLEKVPVNVRIIKQKREKAQVMRPIDRIDLHFSKKISYYNAFPPECTQISDGISSIFLTDRGQNHIKYGKISVTRFRNDYFAPYFGTVFYIYDVEENLLFSPTLLPLGNKKFSYKTKFTDVSAIYTCESDSLSAVLTANLVFGKDTVMWTLNLKNKANSNKKYKIYCYSEVILSDIKNDIAHRTFNNMFLRSEASPFGINMKRTKRDERDKEYFYSLYMPQSEIKAKIQRFSNRFDILKNNCIIPVVDINKAEKGVYSNTEPVSAILVEREIKKKSSQTMHFFQSFSKNEDELSKTRADIAEDLLKVDNILKNNSEIYKITPSEKTLFFEILSFLVYGNFPIKPDNNAEKLPDETNIWQIGISGDFPIFTIRLSKDFDDEFLTTLLKMYTFLSSKNFKFDMVLLTDDEDSYQTPIYKAVKKAVSKNKNNIFVFSLLTIPDAVVFLLQHRSEFYLAAESLKDIISEVKNRKSTSDKIRLKDFPKPQNSSYSCCFEGKNFVINLPEGTNLNNAYSNVIANKKLGFITTQNGGGYTYFKNSREFKITNWVNDPILDTPTEVLYLLDKKDRQVFSLTPYPKNSGDYKITYCQGSSSYKRTGDIETELKLFTDSELAVKYYHITLKNNTTKKPRALKIYYYLKPVLDVSQKLKYNLKKENNTITIESIYKKKFFENTSVKITATRDISSYTFSNLEFIGGGNLVNPDGFNKETFSEQNGQFSNACVLLTFDLELVDTLELAISLSVDEECEKSLDKIKNEEKKVLEFYDDFLSHFQINTPDTDLNKLVNSFLPYQIYACRLVARTSYYQCGGAYGFRDQLQDGISLLHYNPEILKNQIVNAAKRQFLEGDVLHWWHVFDNETEINGIRTRFRDDSLWLIYSVYEYVKISNDYSILNIEIPYISGETLKDGENEKYTTFYTCDKLEPLLSHLERAIKYSVSLSEEGLAHFGGGDWNDGMNRVGEKGKGSSVWLSWFLYENLNRLKALSDNKNNYDEIAEKLKKSVNSAAWDGKWFIRGIYDNGQKLGSKESDECKIDLIAQAWSKISEGGEPQKVNQALNSAYEKLFDKGSGILKLLDPPFSNTKNEPGYIKSYIPGIRENGGQYTHAAVWGAMAFLLNGDTDRGYEIIKALNPVKFLNNKKDLEKYKVEPYVIAADVYAAQNMEGRGGWSWYTGAAGWYYKVIMENFMGIKATDGILTINPSFPSHFTELSAIYKIHGKIFNINYKKGEKNTIFVNGVEKENIIISEAFPQNEVEVSFGI